MIEPSQHVLLCYKNFAANQNISHIGLGVSAINTAKVLNRHGIQAEVLAVLGANEVAARLQRDQDFNIRHPERRFTHCVISAPWIQARDISGILLQRFPEVSFAVNCHSNVGFLQADPNGTALLQDYVDLEQGQLNFKMSANSKKGTAWLRETYQCPCLFLANLYELDYSAIKTHPLWQGGTLRIGAFGAQRPLKNLMSAAGAAAQIAASLKADVEFYMSSGRAEGGGQTVSNAIKAMLSRIRNVKLVEAGWASWPQFRDTVRHMHLLICASYTESFNMVTADGIAEGVPSVTSEALDWVPPYWKANADDTSEIARIGRHLIQDHHAVADGVKALEQHNREGLDAWGNFLGFHVRYKSVVQDPFLI